MGRVSSLTLTDSGNYYTSNPTVTISPPDFDSSLFAAIDSQDYKYGGGALLHDSSNTSTVATLTDTYGGVSQQIAEIAFWIKPSHIEASTIAWSNDFRIVMDSSGYAGISFLCDSTIYQDAHAIDVTQTRYNTNHALDSGGWNFIHFELLGSTLRPNVDSQIGSNYTLNISGNYPYDSGDVIYFGKDSNDTSPIATKTGKRIPSKGFTGLIDNFTFTVKPSQPIFDNIWSTRVPDSANDFYYGQTPEIHERFDYKRATARAYIDSASGEVDRLKIIDSGYGYSTAPTVTISGGRSAAFDSQYDIGDDITQTLNSGVDIRGEVQRYQLDSDSDGSRYLYLAHVGADDGEFRTFVNDLTINKTYPSGSVGLKVTSVSEINKVSETEQNEEFTANYVDDFLDFSEDNPFGDPENQ